MWDESLFEVAGPSGSPVPSRISMRIVIDLDPADSALIRKAARRVNTHYTDAARDALRAWAERILAA